MEFENRRRLERFVECFEEFLEFAKEHHIMATVSISIAFTVSPAVVGVPLTVTPTSAKEDLTVGKPADGTLVAVVTGGTPPYTLPLDSASAALPDGVSLAIDAAGNITLVGTPTTATNTVEQVLVDVTDSAPAAAKAAKK
jgi:hypothetical protein